MPVLLDAGGAESGQPVLVDREDFYAAILAITRGKIKRGRRLPPHPHKNRSVSQTTLLRRNGRGRPQGTRVPEARKLTSQLDVPSKSRVSPKSDTKLLVAASGDGVWVVKRIVEVKVNPPLPTPVP